MIILTFSVFHRPRSSLPSARALAFARVAFLFPFPSFPFLTKSLISYIPSLCYPISFPFLSSFSSLFVPYPSHRLTCPPIPLPLSFIPPTHHHFPLLSISSPFPFVEGVFSVARLLPVLRSIRYDTRCYFNVRSKADISQLNLPHGTDN